MSEKSSANPDCLSYMDNFHESTFKIRLRYLEYLTNKYLWLSVAFLGGMSTSLLPFGAAKSEIDFFWPSILMLSSMVLNLVARDVILGNLSLYLVESGKIIRKKNDLMKTKEGMKNLSKECNAFYGADT